MMNKYVWLACVLLAGLGSCKKDPKPDAPGEQKFQYQLLEKEVGYLNPLILTIAGKEGAAIIFNTELVELNDLSHLVFTVRAASQSGHQVMLSEELLEPLGASWASALNEGHNIYIQPTGERRWSGPQEAGLLLAVTDDGNAVTYKGSWKEKQRRFVGIALNMDDGMHYGWVCVSHEAGHEKLRIHDWAFSKTPARVVQTGKR